MEKEKDYKIATPPKPARKARRKPLTMREQGIEVAIRDGMFVMPSGPADGTPLVAGLRELSLVVYNQVADLKPLKADLEAAVLNANGNARIMLQRALTAVNKRTARLKKLGFNLRHHILEVEGFKPLNEPRKWERN